MDLYYEATCYVSRVTDRRTGRRGDGRRLGNHPPAQRHGVSAQVRDVTSVHYFGLIFGQVFTFL